MKKIISSQDYIDWTIVDTKMDTLRNTEFVELPIIDAELQDLDGNDLFVLYNGHHTLQAAKELGIDIRFVEGSNIYDLTGESLLETCHIDCDWYYVDTESDAHITVW